MSMLKLVMRDLVHAIGCGRMIGCGAATIIGLSLLPGYVIPAFGQSTGTAATTAQIVVSLPPPTCAVTIDEPVDFGTIVRPTGASSGGVEIVAATGVIVPAAAVASFHSGGQVGSATVSSIDSPTVTISVSGPTNSELSGTTNTASTLAYSLGWAESDAEDSGFQLVSGTSHTENPTGARGATVDHFLRIGGTLGAVSASTALDTYVGNISVDVSCS